MHDRPAPRRGDQRKERLYYVLAVALCVYPLTGISAQGSRRSRRPNLGVEGYRNSDYI